MAMIRGRVLLVRGIGLKLARVPTTRRQFILCTGIAAGIGTAAIATASAPLQNDLPKLALPSPPPGSDTFECGLYEASQRQAQTVERQVRHARRRSGPVYRRLYYSLYYLVLDYLIEPAQVLARLAELSAIFVPVLVLLPMCFFGRVAPHSTVPRGAQWWFKLLRWAAERGGATFIKLGQWAALRTDIFPHEMCCELGRLHSHVAAHPLHATRRILLRSFMGMPFDEIFSEFDPCPVGVGAIAQVYTGVLSPQAVERGLRSDEGGRGSDDGRKVGNGDEKGLRSDDSPPMGQRVAIKVIHPGVGPRIARDLVIMKWFAKCIDLLPGMEWLSLPAEVDQFLMLMQMQLDLRIEGQNLERFRENFSRREDVHFARAYHAYTTRDVLVEEYVHAVPMARLLAAGREKRDDAGRKMLQEVSSKGLDAFLQMLIIDNFVHADLHPGNMMVRFRGKHAGDTTRVTDLLLAMSTDDPAETCRRLEQLFCEGYRAEICFLDVGLVTELGARDRRNFIDLFRALLEFDGYRAGELMVERSREPGLVVEAEVFALKMEKLVLRVKERTFRLGSVLIGDLLDKVLGMVRTHHVRMEADFISVVVAILLLEGIGRQLDPELDLFARCVFEMVQEFL